VCDPNKDLLTLEIIAAAFGVSYKQNTLFVLHKIFSPLPLCDHCTRGAMSAFLDEVSITSD